MATQLVDIDDNSVIPDHHKGGYGLALEKLATMLGCDGPLKQQMTDDISEEPHTAGWVDVSDGEGGDRLYLDHELMAKVEWSSRAYWQAEAELADGRVFYCKGSNTEMECDDWSQR